MTYILRKRELPLILLVFAAGIIFGDYYITDKQLASLSTDMTTWALIVASFASCLATVELLRNQGHYVVRRIPRRWIYSLSAMIALLVTLAVGLIFGLTSSTWLFYYKLTITPGGWAFSGVLFFYVSTAAWRVFRIRSIDSTLLLGMCIITLLANAPIGGVIWPGIMPLRTWLDTYITASVAMAFNMGAAIGGIIFGIRVLLGVERRYVA